MNWKLKAFAHAALDRIPAGGELHYWLQRNVTHSLPGSTAEYQARLGISRILFENARRFSAGVPLGIALEIGAGRDLLNQFFLWSMGVQSQIVLDIEPLIRTELLNRSIHEVNRFIKDAGLSCRRLEAGIHGDPSASLLNSYGIGYHAPADARNTGFKGGQIDFISSTNTMEHIPRPDLALILAEFRRVLSPRGVVSLQIDYQDHYSYSDSGISVYNFLQFSDRNWRRFNPRSHFQNRMRHKDYLELFRQAGFEVALNSPNSASHGDLESIRAMSLDPSFAAVPAEELGIRGGVIVLKRPEAHTSATLSA